MGKKRKLHYQQPRPGRPEGRTRNSALESPGLPKSRAGPAKAKKKTKQQHHEKPPTVPFAPHQRILLVGEGDLSFAASLVEHHGCTNVTATVLEKGETELLAKYPHANSNIAIIRGEKRKAQAEDKEENHGEADEAANSEKDQGDQDNEEEQDDGGANSSDEDKNNDDCYDSEDEFDEEGNLITKHTNTKPNNKILYNIDATKLPNSLARPPFDKIIFNFPHVGGKSTDVNRQVRYNQSLLVAFFERALAILPPRGGAIIVTLFEGEPYTLWNVRDLARHAGLQVETSFRFQASLYPGYRHARTLGVVRNAQGEATGGGWKGEDRAARTYIFKRKGDVALEAGKKRRKGDDSSDDEDDD